MGVEVEKYLYGQGCRYDFEVTGFTTYQKKFENHDKTTISKPIIVIMVDQDMTGVLFNLMAKLILKISFVNQRSWGLWNFTRVSQHPI